MLEIKLIGDPLSPLTSLLGPPTKDSGSFTGVLEELIGADPVAGNQIDPQSEANSPLDSPKNTSTHCLEQIETSDSSDIPETLTRSDYESFHLSALPGLRNIVAQLASEGKGSSGPPAEFPLAAALPVKHEGDIGVRHLIPQLPSGNGGTRGQSPLSPIPEKEITSKEEPIAAPAAKQVGDFGVRPIVPELASGNGGKRGQSPLSPISEKEISSKEEPAAALPAKQDGNSGVRDFVPQLALTDGVRDSANFQNQMSLFVRPSPDGRGCREAAGEGDNNRYPSPGPSGHPLPLGEGLPRPSPNLSKSLPADRIVVDPTSLTNFISHITTSPEVQSKPANLIPEATIVSPGPSADANQRRIPERLNLAEFDVTRFEYKTETEPHLSPALQSAQMLQLMRTSLPAREIKPVKPASSFETLMQNASSHADLSARPAMLTRPDEIQHVRLVFEPPPPPPVVRSVTMDIGDPESQVRVVIRERDGNLNVQLGSTNERLREDLQVAGPMLMRELQRNNPMSVTLDFSNFGSATDADGQSQSQSRAKKFLKPDAEFADVAETTYLPGPSSELKSL